VRHLPGRQPAARQRRHPRRVEQPLCSHRELPRPAHLQGQRTEQHRQEQPRSARHLLHSLSDRHRRWPPRSARAIHSAAGQQLYQGSGHSRAATASARLAADMLHQDARPIVGYRHTREPREQRHPRRDHRSGASTR
jgi:hypothetical protein